MLRFAGAVRPAVAATRDLDLAARVVVFGRAGAARRMVPVAVAVAVVPREEDVLAREVACFVDDGPTFERVAVRARVAAGACGVLARWAPVVFERGERFAPVCASPFAAARRAPVDVDAFSLRRPARARLALTRIGAAACFLTVSLRAVRITGP